MRESEVRNDLFHYVGDVTPFDFLSDIVGSEEIFNFNKVQFINFLYIISAFCALCKKFFVHLRQIKYEQIL